MPSLTWRIFEPERPEETLAHATFRAGSEGDSGAVHIRADDPDVREFLEYYLDDPLDQHPVYLEGLGLQHGPLSMQAEVFDHAMSLLGHHFPGFAAEPLEDAQDR